MVRSKLASLLSPVILFLLTFTLYVHNLSASVYGGDSGDFLSAIAVRGVPHPSGYPLYTLLGIIFSALPIHATLAWKIGLISALFSSLAVIVMYFIVIKITNGRLVSIITALTASFLFPFWLFAEVPEVFGLQSFFLLVLFYLGLCLYTTQRVKYLYLLTFITGLSLTNHLLTILILPTLFLFIFQTRKSIPLNNKTLFYCVGLLVLGLSPYLYIPIAALHNPPIDWDHVTTLNNFFHLVMRADYDWGVYASTPYANNIISLQRYFTYIFTEIPVIVLLMMPLGVYGFFKKKQFTILFAICISVVFLGPFFFLFESVITVTGFYFGIIEKFYIASMLFIVLFLPYSIEYATKSAIRILSYASPKFSERELYPLFFTILFLSIPFFLFFHNGKSTDLHTLSLGDTLGRNVVISMPRNSTVVINLNDNIIFTGRYIQYAYGVRKDIHLVTSYDLPIVNSPQAIPLYSSLQGATTGIGETTYIEGVSIAKASPTFIMIPDYNKLTQRAKTLLIPYGLFLKITTAQDQKTDEATFLQQQQHILKNFISPSISPDSISHLLLVSDIPLLYANAYANTGTYLIARYDDYDKAKPYFEKALKLSPDSDNAFEGLGDYFAYKHACKKAEESYESATQINFLGVTVYKKLYIVANTCLHDSTETQKLHSFFSQYPGVFTGIESK